MVEAGKYKKKNNNFRLYKPSNTSHNVWDNKFHTRDTHLNTAFIEDAKFGFIVMDEKGTLFGMLTANERTILHKITVALPNKHSLGGKSSHSRRSHAEKRRNYIQKIAEFITEFFITSNKPNVMGLVLAGPGDLKNELARSNLFDLRLRPLVVSMVDTSYADECGFQQAIDVATEQLQEVKYTKEKKLIEKYFEEIDKDSGRSCYGVKDTISALELGAIEKLICWENLNIQRHVVKSHVSTEETIVYLNPQEQRSYFNNGGGATMELVSSVSLLDWLTNNYKSYGTKLLTISDKTKLGIRFVHGFGGIGGILR